MHTGAVTELVRLVTSQPLWAIYSTPSLLLYAVQSSLVSLHAHRFPFSHCAPLWRAWRNLFDDLLVCIGKPLLVPPTPSVPRTEKALVPQPSSQDSVPVPKHWTHISLLIFILYQGPKIRCRWLKMKFCKCQREGEDSFVSFLSVPLLTRPECYSQGMLLAHAQLVPAKVFRSFLQCCSQMGRHQSVSFHQSFLPGALGFCLFFWYPNRYIN